MKMKRTLTALLLVLCLITSMLPSAFASSNNSIYKGKSWEKITESFLKKYESTSDGKTPSLTLGYINLVTGEEHFYKGDEYMNAYSMYTVPLNMYYTQKISEGSMDWDTQISGEKYSMLLERSIVFSSNARSRYLVNAIGTFREYRDAISAYMGLTPKKADKKYYENNLFTARQMIRCLENLYKGGDKYPELINAMLEASPEEYFCGKNQGYDIAHKFTYYKDEGKNREYVGDCAIVYTEEPIAIVMFSDTIDKPEEALVDYCELMCSYAQANLKPKPTPTPIPSPLPYPTASPEATASPEITASPAPSTPAPLESTPAPTPLPETIPEVAPTPTPYSPDMYAPTPDSVPFSPAPTPTPEPQSDLPEESTAPTDTPNMDLTPAQPSELPTEEQIQPTENQPEPVPETIPESVPEPTPEPTPVHFGDAENKSSTYASGQEIVDYAMQYLGYKYVYGEKSPEKGFDCSGFVYYVYEQFGYTLNRIAAAQAKNGTHVELDSLEPGDVLCFYNLGSAIGHVGIYIGGGEYIHAEGSNTGVVISSLSSRTCKIEARRIL